MAATHKGTCQICGRIQKLPKGLLSLHGYQVEWGMFNGVCDGATNLPYEQSCEVLKAHVARMNNHLEDMRRSRENILNSTVQDRVWIYEHNRKLRDFFWHTYPLHAGKNGDFYYTDGAGNEKFGCSANYIEGYIKHQREERAQHIQWSVDRLEKYIKGQQARIDNWKPAELLPL